ncbi:unnamed protein product [Didymodactylos carnosus]|uniref:Uncharacterized protein n=1 Tax=Didymodactylos carnosus TaxID=1234261 RepID=A0A813WUD7_9BILA|nr:unnamed protein product [Didymodactylos carnosus]CAF3647561.1 unnamed protein product [Didymodactylos carnosus]
METRIQTSADIGKLTKLRIEFDGVNDNLQLHIPLVEVEVDTYVQRLYYESSNEMFIDFYCHDDNEEDGESTIKRHSLQDGVSQSNISVWSNEDESEDHLEMAVTDTS